MATEEERLELVTDFASLKAGDLVLVKRRDGVGVHRGVLVKFHPEHEDNYEWDEYGAGGDSWEVCPPPPDTRLPDIFVASANAVSDRRVYRIDTGLSREAETVRKKERVR